MSFKVINTVTKKGKKRQQVKSTGYNKLWDEKATKEAKIKAGEKK